MFRKTGFFPEINSSKSLVEQVLHLTICKTSLVGVAVTQLVAYELYDQREINFTQSVKIVFHSDVYR